MVGLRRDGSVARAVLLITDRSRVWFYLTLTANRPGTFIPIKRATSELAGSITTTNPVQSSLKMVCLQFGQTGPALIMRQVLHALSVSFSSPPSQPLPASSPFSLPLTALLSAPPESTQSCPGKASSALCRSCLQSLLLGS